MVLLNGCTKEFSKGTSVMPILGGTNQLILAYDSLSNSESSNLKGEKIEGFTLYGVRVIDSAQAFQSKTNSHLFIVSDPVTRGLLEFFFYERKNERATSVSAPIRFLTYKAAWNVKVSHTGEILNSKRVRFGILSIQLHPTEFELNAP